MVWHLREFVDLHGETPVFWNTVEAWKKINRSDRVICVSNYLEQAYKNKIQDGSKLQVIYDGINMSCFKAKTKTSPKEKIVIGLAGTAPIKNHKECNFSTQESFMMHVIMLLLKLQGSGQWTTITRVTKVIWKN